MCIPSSYLFHVYFPTTLQNLEFSLYQNYNVWNIDVWYINICGKRKEKNEVKDQASDVLTAQMEISLGTFRATEHRIARLSPHFRLMGALRE